MEFPGCSIQEKLNFITSFSFLLIFRSTVLAVYVLKTVSCKLQMAVWPDTQAACWLQVDKYLPTRNSLVQARLGSVHYYSGCQRFLTAIPSLTLLLFQMSAQNSCCYFKNLSQAYFIALPRMVAKNCRQKGICPTANL